MMAIKTAKPAAAGIMQHTGGIFADQSLDGLEIGTLVVVLDRAKNLPNRRTMGKQDPYCACRLGKESKKTETDIRGGQVPRWDQELRFTVHESTDFHKLKVSVFNEDKKTDLIGETWIDLTSLLLPGGGQNDKWHALHYKGKYAGEIRIELTFYDTRPKTETRHESKRERANTLQRKTSPTADGEVGGPRQEPTVKHQPLASTPPTSSNTPERTNSTPQAPSGLGGYHTPPSHGQAVDSAYRRPVEHRVAEPYQEAWSVPRPLPDPTAYDHSSASIGPPPSRGHSMDEASEPSRHHPHQDQRHDQWQSQGLQDVNNGNSIEMPYCDDPYALQAVQSNPEPMNNYTQEAASKPHHNRVQALADTGAPRQPPPLSQIHSAPNVLSHEFRPNNVTYQKGYPVTGYEQQSPPHTYGLRAERQPQQEERYVQPAYDAALPPPPPAHRYSAPPGPDYSCQPPRESRPRTSASSQIYQELTDRSAVPPTNRHYSDPIHDLDSRKSYQTSNSYPQPQVSSYGAERRRSDVTVGRTQYENYELQSRMNAGSYPGRSQNRLSFDPQRREALRSAGQEDFGRADNFAQTRPLPHIGLSASGFNRGRDLKTCNFDPAAPIIKPRAISPGGQTLLQSQIPRKSVSSQPILPQAQQKSSVPFGPDSYDAFNPGAAVSPTDIQAAAGYPPVPSGADIANATYPANGTSTAPIVRSDGQVVDPSDHLPTTSWAPEPERKGASKPTTPTTVKVRLGPRDARSSPNSTPVHSQSVSPANNATPSSTSRIRLTKKSPNGSGSSPLAPSPPNALNFSSPYPPPIPAKIPLHQTAVEDYAPGGTMTALSQEMQSIDIGPMPAYGGKGGRARRSRFGA